MTDYRFSHRKPRIAQIITRMVPGGASRVVKQITKGLKENYSFDLLTGIEDLPSTIDDRPNGIQNLKTLSSLVRDISPYKDLKALFELKNILSLTDYDLIHTHTSKAGFLGRLAGAWAGVPAIIHSTHGLIYESAESIPGVPTSSIGQRILAIAERSLKSTHDLLITLSEHEKKMVEKLKLSKPSNTRAVFNGVNIEKHTFCPKMRQNLRTELNVSENDLLIVSVGRLAKEKGHDLLIKSFKDIKKSLDNVKLLIAGKGPEKSALSQIADQIDPENIYLPGHIDEIQAVYSAADIYVQPSRYEGFGLSVLEAMSYGLPVVASKVGGIPELIQEDKNGLLVDPEDIPAITKKLLNLCQNKELRDKLGRTAQESSQNYSLEKMLEAYDSIYSKTLSIHND